MASRFSTSRIGRGLPKYTSIGGSGKATGGTITKSNEWVIHTFTEDGSFVTLEPLDIEYLVVAGGGAGGLPYGGGGGAGGYLAGSTSIVKGTYVVTVGAGGAGLSANATAQRASSGNDSTFGEIYRAYGGGAGGCWDANSIDIPQSGVRGGSGGGGGARNNTSTGAPGATAVFSQGNAGADGGQYNIYGGSGGGGSSAAGSKSGTTTTSGAGGNGTANSITGTSVTYAGGGAGGIGAGAGTNFATGSAGTGGGGAGGYSTNGTLTQGGQNGTANTGGGGGGGAGIGQGHSNTGTSGNGGSGIVIVRYRG